MSKWGELQYRGRVSDKGRVTDKEINAVKGRISDYVS
jgi:hypothetical protein